MQTFPTLVDMQRAVCQQYAQKPIFGTKTNGQWQWISYKHFSERVRKISRAFHSLGIAQGDRVAMIGRNSKEWAECAYATYSLGAVFVPMYEQQSAEDRSFILKDCGAKVAVMQNTAIAKHIIEQKKQDARGLADLKHLVIIDQRSEIPQELQEQAKQGTPEELRANLYAYAQFESLDADLPENIRIQPDDLMGLIYTSGTTGTPKGVMLTHKNILFNCHAIKSTFNWSPENRSLSFLPWAHILGQVGDLHLTLYKGTSTAFAEHVTKIVDNIQEIKPTFFISVPKIFNRIYERIHGKMNTQPKPLQALFKHGLAAAQKRDREQPLGLMEKLTLFLADKILFTKFRAAFGGNLKMAMSGGAALDPEVGRFIQALGILIYEGYGLSETSPIIAANIPGACRIGSVGRPIPGARVEIDTDVEGAQPGEGEVVAYGDMVMKGYFNRPEETAKAITAQGGMRTGDLGRVDKDGYLHITGRIKEQYKLENGKFVVPSPLEERLKLSPYITNALVFGENRPFNVAILGVNIEGLEDFQKQQSLKGDMQAIIKDPRVLNLFRIELDRFQAGWKEFEKAQRFVLVLDDWTPENGLLTPSLKVKRRNVIEKYQQQLEQIYSKN